MTKQRRALQLRVAEAIASELRDRIFASGDADGFRLPTQDQLVEEFGVSYPSVREAIRILETEGLITVRRGNVGGAEVHPPDATFAGYHLGLVLQGGQVTLGDLAQGLQTLEPLCAAECARRPDRMDELVPALEANIEASSALVDAGPEFTQTARELHDLVVTHTPTATIRHVVSALVALWSAQEIAWAETSARRGRYPSEGDAREVLAAHRRLTEAIAAGRADRAEHLARAHLVATQALLRDRFDTVVSARSIKRAP